MAAMAKIVCSTSIKYAKDEITVKYMLSSRPNTIVAAQFMQRNQHDFSCN